MTCPGVRVVRMRMLWLVRMFSTHGLTTAPSLLRVAVKGTLSAPGL